MAKTEEWYGFVNGFIEVVMTVFGLMVVLTPLALWVSWNEVVYYGTLATAVIGAAMFFLFATLLSRLHASRPDIFRSVDPDTGLSYAEAMRTNRLTDWEALQEDDPVSHRQRMAFRDDVTNNLNLVFATASALMVIGFSMLAAAWAFFVATFETGE